MLTPDHTMDGAARHEPLACIPAISHSAPQRRRWKITPEALELMEQVYRVEPCPSSTTREQLATAFNCTPRQVQVWFQNKRQRGHVKAKRTQDEMMAAQMPAVAPTPSQMVACGLTSSVDQHPGIGGGWQIAYGAMHTTSYSAPMQPGNAAAAYAGQKRHCDSLESSEMQTQLMGSIEHANTRFPTDTNTMTRLRHNRSTDSLADLAIIASRVDANAPAPQPAATPGLPRHDSLANLAMVASRVESFSDLQPIGQESSTVPPSRVISLADLASLPRAGSLADLSMLTRDDMTMS